MLRLRGAGLAAGICLGAKHSGILLFPMLLVLALAELLSLRDPATKKFPAGIARDSALSSRFARGHRGDFACGAVVLIWIPLRRAPCRTGDESPLRGICEASGPQLFRLVPAIARWHLLAGIVSVRSRGYFSAADDSTVIFGKYYPSAQWFYFPSVFIDEVHSGVPGALLSCPALRQRFGESNFAGRCFS